MSEKLNINFENSNNKPEHASKHHERKHEIENKSETENHLSAKEKQERLNELRNQVKKESSPVIESRIDNSVSEKNKTPQGPINKELKNMMLTRTLNRIRKELPAPQRAFSKVIHSKPVEAVSAVSEKTIARPIGILGGGFISLVGSLVVLYMAKHYGFRYNLLLFFLLFVSGYLVTTLFELLFKVSKKVKN